MTPQELKNSILRLAIQGKLVEQRPEECQVDISQLKTKKTEEFDFDLPEKWIVAHLESICKSIPTKQYQVLESEVKKEGTFAVISQSKEYSIGYTDNGSKVFCHDTPVIVFGDHTTEVKYVTFDFVVGADGVKIFQPLCEIIEPKYLYYVFLYNCIDLNKVGGYSRHYKYIKDKPVPLPPLTEQKRIVAKIEELLPLIERYEKAWSRLEDFNKRFPVDMQKSILQMAIQGRLAEQRPEEGTGEELYRQIQAEKQSLIRSGKLKKDKPLPSISDDEIPFDIPDSWKWCYVGDLFQHNTGKALNGSDKSGTPMAYITTSNLYWDRFELEKLKEMPFTESEVEKCTVKKGDLLVCEGGDYGRSAIWPYDYPMRIQNHIHRLRAYGSISARYFYYCFYLYKNAGMIAGKGIAIQGLSANALHALKMPLPPLAEQKRIVAKLESLLPLCDKLK